MLSQASTLFHLHESYFLYMSHFFPCNFFYCSSPSWISICLLLEYKRRSCWRGKLMKYFPHHPISVIYIMVLHIKLTGTGQCVITGFDVSWHSSEFVCYCVCLHLLEEDSDEIKIGTSCKNGGCTKVGHCLKKKIHRKLTWGCLEKRYKTHTFATLWLHWVECFIFRSKSNLHTWKTWSNWTVNTFPSLPFWALFV